MSLYVIRDDSSELPVADGLLTNLLLQAALITLLDYKSRNRTDRL